MPTGTVTFRDGERVLGTAPLDHGGQAGVTVTDLAAGEHDVRADYAGDTNFAPSSATLHQTVGRATTSTTVISSAASAAFGAVVTLEATVRADIPGPPTGTVTFRDGTSPLGTVALDATGVARLGADLGWGSHTISAIYTGDAVFGPSLATMTQIVQANTVTALTATPTRSSFGDPVALTAIVRSAAPDTITGDVTFRAGDDPLGIVPLDTSGEARLLTTSLPVGDHRLSAQYLGDSHFAPSAAETHHHVGERRPRRCSTPGSRLQLHQSVRRERLSPRAKERGLSMCLNRKVLTAAGVVALGVLLFAPRMFGAVLPLLMVAICPLSMLLMMRAMSGSGNRCQTGGAARPASGGYRRRDRRMQAEIDRLRAEVAGRPAAQPIPPPTARP